MKTIEYTRNCLDIKMKFIWLFFLLILLISCSKENKSLIKNETKNYKSENYSKDSSQIYYGMNADKEPKRNMVVSQREFPMQSGKSLIIIEHYGDGFSSRDITIRSKGFLKDNIFNFESAGYVDSVMISDLNDDGQKEIYMLIGNGGSGGMEDLLGFTILNDEMVKIDTKEIYNVANGNYFDVSKIMGHDNYYTEGKYLINTVPLYNEDDPNCCPTGGQINIFYGFEIINDHPRLYFSHKN